MSGPYREPWRPRRGPTPRRASRDGPAGPVLLSFGCTLMLILWSGPCSDAGILCAWLAGGALGIGLSLAIRTLGDYVDPGE